MVKKILFLVAFFWSAAVFSQCNYSFVMTDTGGNGWSGNTMSVIQNSAVVTTFGSTFTSGSGPVTVTVPLADGVPFQLRWNSGGTLPNQIAVSVLNPFGETLYTKVAGSGSQNSILFTGNASCTQCIKPTNVSVSGLTQTSATISWNDATEATQWEVLVLPASAQAPNASQTGAMSSNPIFLATGLTCGLSYKAYVKTICSSTNSSVWAVSSIFSADVCDAAIASCLGANSLCGALGVPFQNTTGASNQGVMGCLGSTPNAAWFYFSVSAVGTANMNIVQNTSFDSNGNGNGTQLDADYILYGPYNEPVTPCNGQLAADKIISCSYSANPVENFTLDATQPGAYYYLMVTNFSNNPGFIKISQTSGSSIFDCTGYKLNAFLDSNTNGVRDTNEQAFSHGQFQYQKNNTGDIHNVVSSTGILNIIDGNSANSYDFTFQINPDYAPYYALTTPSYNDVVLTGAGITTVNFPVTASTPYQDVSVNIVALGEPRPGFTYKNRIVYTNNGNQTANGTVSFVKDAAISITNISQAGTVATADGFTYDFTNLAAFETRIIEVTMQVPTIPTVQLGNLLHNSASVSILPTVDAIVSNNTFELTQEIIGSYDPNDIMEAHGKEIVHATFDSDDYLYYTIRFENTGSASAINVTVNNALDAKLDETSLRMVGSSHNFVMDRVNTTVNWNFNNIMLAATSQNPNASKGYVVYRIKPKLGYAVGDIIPSTASIYFDYNPAIVTNTFNTEFVAQLSTTEFENTAFVFYPNPAKDLLTVAVKDHNVSISEIIIYDLTGKMILNQKSKTGLTEVLDVSNLSGGLYLLEVTTNDDKKMIKKLLVE